MATTLLSVQEALALVADSANSLPAENLQLSDALGRTLAADSASDIDSPPYDKAMMDGFAVLSGDPSQDRTVLEEVTAGDLPSHTVTLGNATRIMTGAPMPKGADAVVPVESTKMLGTQTVRLPLPGPPAGKHVMPRGESYRRGIRLIEAGTSLTPAHVALLAESGNAVLSVYARPTVGCLATGDELVAPNQTPAPGQIRNSNGPLLRSLIQEANAEPVELGVARDTTESLREHLQRARGSHVLLLSGGVSAGVKDLAPQVLADLGVQQVFHKVAVKPGKPLWFGRWPQESGGTTFVFGLPGNPVSGFVCFHLFVRPLLSLLSGRSFAGPPEVSAVLSDPLPANTNRETYLPARVRCEQSRLVATATAWRGSADIAGMSAANALLRLPAGQQGLAPGEPISALLLQGF